MKTDVMKRLIPIVIFALVIGCVGPGKLTPQTGEKATQAVTVAQGLLHALDGFYGDLLKLKIVPDYTVHATRALAMADSAAAQLRAVIAGATVTDAELNVLAGKVDGAEAVKAALEQK